MMRDDHTEDIPPYSRLFVVCNKTHKEDDLRPAFEVHGSIENFYMPRDRNTGESKGIAYVKYKKTSSAAAAVEALHMKNLPNSSKPIKVMVASKKNEEDSENENKYKRLFIKVARDATETEIVDCFKKFGSVVDVRLQKNRETKECKGFAYVNYKTFLEAAKAFEECDRKYKPVFAIPRNELKRTRNIYDQNDQYSSGDPFYAHEYSHDNHNIIYNREQQKEDLDRRDRIMPLITTPPKDFDTINVLCVPFVPQKPLEKLFNIIPGMIQFKFSVENFRGLCRALVKYESKTAAAYAMEMLNNYEFPSGEVITVKPEENALSLVANNLSHIVNSFKNSFDGNKDLKQLAEVIAQASTLIQAATSGTETRSESNDSFCSVKLPAPKPFASPDSKVAKRCFIVLKAHSLSPNTLRDVFCRFGDLIDVYVPQNKSFGFARYATEKAAYEAINTLHGATVHGITIKVLEAEDKVSKNKSYDDHESSNTDITERKRPKLEDMVTDNDF